MSLSQLNDQRSRAALVAARFLEPRSSRLAFGNVSWNNLADAVESTEELRSAVGRYARVLRDLGEPPERVIILVKEFAAEVTRACNIDDVEAHTAISTEFVRWSIDAYYAST